MDGDSNSKRHTNCQNTDPPFYEIRAGAFKLGNLKLGKGKYIKGLEAKDEDGNHDAQGGRL
jgi:hypothetical protein